MLIKIKSKIIIKVLIIFWFLFFIFWFFFLKSNPEIIEKDIVIDSKQSVLVEKLKLKSFEEKIILRGFTQASRTVVLKSQVEGKISVINYKKGFEVKAGDRIVLIDPEDKIAKTKEMEALLEQRKKEYEVAEKLFKNGFRSEVKLSESRTNFERSLALFEKSQVDLNNTKVIIPFDSFLEESYVELGDYLKKGDEIVKIVDLNPIYLEASASEKEVIKLRNGQSGFAVLGNGIKLNGLINYISSSANKTTRDFIVQFEISNPTLKILSGISGEIFFLLKPISAYFIPPSVITLNGSGDIGIKIVMDRKVKFKKIKILSDTGKGYWIKKIIEDNDDLDLIVRGQEFVLDGETVDIEYSK